MSRIVIIGARVIDPDSGFDDIADVAIAALTEPQHAGQLYVVTGPRLLTFADAAADLSAATGRAIQYVPITLEQFHDGMKQTAGEFVADVFTEICRETLDGRNESLGDGVQRALGRAPRDFTDMCRAAAAAGAWKEAA